jgi:uncharacterized C2H2 Zn-finger protein
MPVSNNESSDIFVLSNPSQPLSQCALPLPLDHHFLVHTPTKAGSWVNCSWPAMPVTNSGTVVLLVPCLNCSHQPFPTNQFDFQDIGLDLEYSPQTLDNYTSTTTVASQALPPHELPNMATSSISPSIFDSHAISSHQTPSSTSSFTTQYSPYSLSLEAASGLPASPYHKSQTPACPLLNCGATFKRIHDLKRHVDTVHGPKQDCPHSYCPYKTGRKDKMLEHVRKMHGKA